MKASKLFTTSIITILILFLTFLPTIELKATVLDATGAAALIADQGTAVTIPSTYTVIGDLAFFDSSLTSVTIPNSVTSIGNQAFSRCYNLTSVNIPNSVTSIDWEAFYGCSKLTTISIPGSVTSIPSGAFKDSGLESIVIPNSVTSIGSLAFRNSNLTSITIPNSVTSIASEAFYGCSRLTTVSIPDSVTSIPDQAFKNSGLSSVVIPSSVTSIGSEAFYGCSNLTAVTIPDSVTSVGLDVFKNSGLSLVTIHVSEAIANYPNFSTSLPSYSTVLYQPLPQIASFSPANGAADVPTEIYLQLEFNQPMNRNSVMDSVLRLSRLDSGHQQQFDLPLNSAETSNLIQAVWSPDDKKLTVNANAFKLDPAATYKVEMVENRAKGSNGLALNLTQPVDLLSGVTFTTADQEKAHAGQPKIVSISPANGQVDVETEIYLQLEFNQEMDPGSVMDSVIRLSEVSGQTTTTQFDLPLNSLAADQLIQVQWSDGNKALTVNANYFKLATSTTYRVEMVENRARGINDMPLVLGHPVDLSQGITFTTADQEKAHAGQPKIISTYPENGQVGVETEIYLQLDFNQEMNPGSVMDSVIRLSQLESNGITVVDRLDLPLNSLAADQLIQAQWSDNNKTLTVNANYFKLATSTTYRVEMVENRAKGVNDMPLVLGQPVDLSQGITFTTADQEKAHAGQPSLLSITPQDGDIGVPNEIYLQLEFDQPMDTDSVLESVLRFHQLDKNGQIVNHLDLRLDSVVADDLIEIDWSENDRIVTISSKAFKLATDTTYQVELVKNRAKSINGLPLRLGHPIDLSKGITFTTAIEARITEEVTAPIGIPTPIPGVAVDIPQGTQINVPMDIHFSAELSVLTSLGPIKTKTFESEDGVLEGSMLVSLPPNTSFTVTEKYSGHAVSDTIFPLPTYDFQLPTRQDEYNTGFATDSVIYQINLRAQLSDLLAMVLGDFNGTSSLNQVLTDIVELELTATKDIPAGQNINFASGFTVDLSRSMKVERFTPCTLSVDLNAVPGDVYVNDIATSSLNQTITVSVVATEAQDVDSYSFILKYNPREMRLIPGSIQRGSFLGENAYFIPNVDQENGRISISQSRFNSEADFGQSGNGQLVILEFQLIDAGQLNLEIEPDEALVFNSAREQYRPQLKEGPDAVISVPRPDPSVRLEQSRSNVHQTIIQDIEQALPDYFIDIQVWADGLTNLDSYDLVLSYSNNILEPITDGQALLFFDQQGNISTGADQNDNMVTVTSIDQDTGQVRVSRARPGNDPLASPDGSFKLFELRLRAKQSGVGEVRIDQLQLIDVQDQIDTPPLAIAKQRVLISAPLQSVAGEMATFALDRLDNQLDNILVEIEIPAEYGRLKAELDDHIYSIPSPFGARNDVGTALSFHFLDPSGADFTDFVEDKPLVVRIPFDPAEGTNTIVLMDGDIKQFLPTRVVNGNTLEAELDNPGGYIFTLRNNDPIASPALGTRTVDEDAAQLTIDLRQNLTDQDLGYGDQLSYQIEVSDPDSILDVDDSQLPEITLTFREDQNGSANLTATVTDLSGQTLTDILLVEVNPINDEPTFTLSETEIEQDEDFPESVTIAISPGDIPADETEQDVTYSLSPADLDFAQLSLDDGLVTITAIENQYGSATVVVTAIDDGLTGSSHQNSFSQTFSLVINPVNDDPVVIAPDGMIRVSKNSNASNQIELKAKDIDALILDQQETEILTFNLEDGPSDGEGTLYNSIGEIIWQKGTITEGVSLEPVINQGIFYTVAIYYQPEPDFVTPGSESVSLIYTVTDLDGAESQPQEVAIIVANDPPVAKGQEITTDEDLAVSITLSAIDINNDDLTYMIVDQPSKGQFAIDGNLVTYTPYANVNNLTSPSGLDSFTYIANDGTEDSQPATITIDITPVNDAPIANNQNVELDASSPTTPSQKSITLQASDVDGDPLTFTIVSQPSYGTLSGSGGSRTYTPTINYTGSDSFIFGVEDPSGLSSQAAITITVNETDEVKIGANVAPIAISQPEKESETLKVNEGQSLSITLTATDLEEGELSYQVVDPPQNGTLSGTAPNLTYRSNPGFGGTDSFTFVVNDGEFDSLPATVRITVNAAPVPVVQELKINEGQPLPVTLTATDLEEGELSYQVVDPPQNGTLSGTTPNLTYLSNLGFGGTDSFTFTASDTDQAVSQPTTISIIVNAAPVAVAQDLKVDEGTEIVIRLIATDLEEGELTYQVVDPPQNGTLSGTAPNLTYLSNLGFGGTDSFIFTVSDTNQAVSQPTTISIIVNAVPVAESQELTIGQGQELPIVLLATDIESATLTYQVVGQPQNGELSGTAPDLVYVPNPNHVGSDSFTFVVNDGTLESLPANVVVTVNASPVAEGQELIAKSGTELPIKLAASDAENDKLNYLIEANPLHGTITGTGADIIYVSNKDYQGEDSFTFVASDEFSASLPVTVSITVRGNLPPVAASDKITILEDSRTTKIDLLGNDYDPEEDEIVLISVSLPQNGTIEQSQGGVVFYTPNEDYFSVDKADTFTYEISDGQGNNSQGIVEVFVEPVNDLPTAKNDKFTGDEDKAINITLTAEDLDKSEDGSIVDELNYQIIDPPFYGELSGEAPNLVYTPNENYFGSDRFTFLVNDGTEESNLAQVDIEIESVFDPPSFTTLPDDLRGEYLTGNLINLLLAVANPDSIDLSYQLRGIPDEANAKLDTIRDGVRLSWLPVAQFAGTYSVTISAISENNPPVDLTFEMIIIQVNRNPILQSITPQLVPIGESLSVTVTAEDPDQEDNIEFSIRRLTGKGSLPIFGPVEISQDEKRSTIAVSTLEWTPEETDQSQLVEFIILATDSQGAVSQTSLSIGVGSVNTPPQLVIETGDRYNLIETITESQVNEGLLINFSASDIQEDTLKLSVLGLPKGAVFTTDQETNTGKITWLPDQNAGDGPEGFQLYTLQLVAEEVHLGNKESLQVKKPVRIRVQNLNSIPKLSPINDLEAKEGDTVDFIINATDDDQEPISLLAKGLPLGAILIDNGDGSARFEWQIPFGFSVNGPVSISVLAQDTEGKVKTGVNIRNFQITAISVNRPPEQIGQSSQIRVLERDDQGNGPLVESVVEFIDPDKQINPLETIELTLQPSSVKGPQLIMEDEGRAIFSWQTDGNAGQEEAYQFEIVATDVAGAEAFATVMVIIENVNQRPKFVDVQLPEVLEGESVVVPLLAIDPDDNEQEILLFEVNGDFPSGMATIAGSDLLIKPQIGQAGEYNLKLTVLDREGAKDRVNVVLIVKNQNLPPEIQLLEPIYNAVAGDRKGKPLEFSLDFNDPNGDSLAVSLDSNLPSGYQFDEENRKFSWLPGLNQFGEYDLKFTIREIDTVDKYEVVTNTRISVLNPNGPIMRNLKFVSRGSGIAQLSIDLDTALGDFEYLSFKVNDEIVHTKNQIRGEYSYTLDTSKFGQGEVTEYLISAEGFINPNKSIISIGPIIIDNTPPKISFTPSTIEAGTGELLNLDIGVTDNGLVERVMVIFGGQQVRAGVSSAGNYKASFAVTANPKSDLKSAGIDFKEIDGIIEFPVSIRATDLAGNTAVYPEQPALLIARLLDKTLPVAKIDRDKVIVRQGDKVRLSGEQSTDNSGLIHSYSWDLDNRDGITFRSSEYQNKYLEFTAKRSSTLTLQVSDASGNTATASAEIEVIDKTPPEPPIFSLVELEGRKVKVEGEAEAGSNLILSLSNTATMSNEEWSIEVDENGFFSISGFLVDEGLYVLRATAVDQALNISRPTIFSDNVLIDLTAPEIVIGLDGSDSLNETNNVQPPVTIEIFDAGGVGDTQLFLFEEGSTPVSIEGGNRQNGEGEKTSLFSLIPLRNLFNDLTYNVKVISEDLSGNKSQSEYQFRVNLSIPDTSPPQVRILSPRTEGMLIGYRRPRFKAVIQDLGGFDLSTAPFSVSLSTITQEVNLKGVSVKGDTNKIELTAFPAEELEPAEYTFSIQVQDKNGNQQIEKRTFFVIGPPTGMPVNGNLNRSQLDAEEQWLSVSSTVITGELDISLFPGGGSVEVYRNNQLQVTTSVDEKTGRFTTNLPLLEGKNQVSILPVNIVGLKGQMVAIETFVVDTQKPIVDSLQPSNGSTLTAFNSLRAVVKDSTIVSSVSSGINPDSISLIVDGQVINDFSYDPASGLLAYQPTFGQQDAREYRVLLEVSDVVGNISQTEIRFQTDPDEEDTIPPTIAGLFPRNGQIINSQQLEGLELSASIYDVGSGLSAVWVRLDGQTINLSSVENIDVSTTSEDKVSIKPSQLSEGKHSLTVYAKDKSGNETVINSDFVVDTKVAAPYVPNLSSFVNQSRTNLSGVAEDRSTVNSFVNGQPGPSIVADAKGKFNLDLMNLNEGVNEIYLESTDVAGNQSQRSALISLFVDLQPPVIGNPVPGDGQRTQSKLLEMKVELADNPGGSGIDTDSLQFVLDGNQPLWEFGYQAESGLLSYVPDENSSEVLSLPEGLHTFRVVASDLAGNQTIFDSGQFYVDLTAPTITDLLPVDGAILTSPSVKVQALIKDKDVNPDQVEVKIKPLDSDSPQILTHKFDPISGKLLAQVENELSSGSYVVMVSVADTAGNISQQEVSFKLDVKAIDSQPPIIRPLFPLPDQEVSTVSLMAIKFEVLDADSDVNFEEMVVEINGVIYEDLFKKGSGNRYNRETGEVILFGRLQLELGGLEDPLELGGLEDPLELGGLEDPLELGGLEDPLELGVLNKPVDLSLGANLVSISVSDAFQNVAPFQFSFDVSLTPASIPTYDLVPPQPATISDLKLNRIIQQEAEITAGKTFTFSFEARENVVAAFMDLSQMDDSFSSIAIGQPINNDSHLALNTIVEDVVNEWELLRPSLDLDTVRSLLEKLVAEGETAGSIEIPNLQRILLYRDTNTPIDVRYGSSQFQAKGKVPAETKVKGGEKSLSLLVISQDLSAAVPLLELDLAEIKVEFTNPTTDQKRRSSRRRGRRSRQSNRLQLGANDMPQLLEEETVATSSLATVVTEYQGILYTNTTDIPLRGQIDDLDEGRQVEVEVFVNDNSMGNVPVDSQGRFKLDKLLLETGMNTVTSFSRTSSQLQSPASAPLQVFVDQQLPKVSFVDLPTHLSQTEAQITLGFTDDSPAPAQSMTLFVNGQAQPILVDQNTIQVTIQLEDGNNQLALSAVDLVGNVSLPQQRSVIVDSSPPDTVPSQLRANLNAAGNQVELNWLADNNAASYHLYRSSQPITGVSRLEARARNLSDTQFVDDQIDLAQTYYYAVSSVSPAGLESLTVSENLNLTIISSSGGTAVVADGSRITFGPDTISADSTLRLAVSVEVAPKESETLPLLDQVETLPNSDRQFRAISQNGLPFVDALNQNATVSMPYPAGETAESIRVYALADGDWKAVVGIEINQQQRMLKFETDRLTRFRLAIPISPAWDPNRDGRVDIFDLVTVANDFGKSIYDRINSVGNDLGQTDGLMTNDINGDGQVDIFDLASLVSATKKDRPKLPGDVNEDGYVDIFDLALVAIHFGEQYQSDQPASAPAMVQGPTQGWVVLKPLGNDNSSTLNISLSAQIEQRLKGYQFSLSYDPALLSVIQIEEGEIWEGAAFSFEPDDCQTGQAKFAAVNLDQSELNSNQTSQELTLANLVVQIHGNRVDALSSLRLDEVILSNPSGDRISVSSQSLKPTKDPFHFELSQNYPNPFNPETWIPYHLSADSQVEISIYNSTGKLIRELDVGWQLAGNYQDKDQSAYWDGRNKLGEPVSSGVYFYTIRAGKYSDTRKMLLMK